MLTDTLGTYHVYCIIMYNLHQELCRTMLKGAFTQSPNVCSNITLFQAIFNSLPSTKPIIIRVKIEHICSPNMFGVQDCSLDHCYRQSNQT